MNASVVVPTYNGSKTLPHLLGCLCRVDPRSIAEVIVCDDGSSEDIQSLALAFKSRLNVKYLRQDRAGERAASARNLGIGAATGDVIIFLDDDVTFPAQLIDVHLRRHKRKLARCLVFGFRHSTPDTLEDFGVGRCNDHRIAKLGDRGQRLIDCSTPWYYVYSCNLSMPRSTPAHYFDDSFVGWGNEDIDFAYRLWREDVELILEPLATVFHNDSPKPRDPYQNYDKGRMVNFDAAILNTIRMLVKYPNDALLQIRLKRDLEGFALKDNHCLRESNAKNVDQLIAWASPQLLKKL